MILNKKESVPLPLYNCIKTYLKTLIKHFNITSCPSNVNAFYPLQD